MCTWFLIITCTQHFTLEAIIFLTLVFVFLLSVEFLHSWWKLYHRLGFYVAVFEKSATVDRVLPRRVGIMTRRASRVVVD